MSEFFNNIPKIAYEGKDSKNPLAFKFYNPDEVIAGKTMREQLKFAVLVAHYGRRRHRYVRLRHHQQDMGL